MSAPYEIGAATAGGWVALVVLRGGQSKEIAPWEARQVGAHWAVLEGVERATMLTLNDVPRTLYVAQTSVVSVCRRTDPEDGFAGLRLRLSEGLFTVLHGDPGNRPACLQRAMDLVRAHAEGLGS